MKIVIVLLFIISVPEFSAVHADPHEPAQPQIEQRNFCEDLFENPDRLREAFADINPRQMARAARLASQQFGAEVGAQARSRIHQRDTSTRRGRGRDQRRGQRRGIAGSYLELALAQDPKISPYLHHCSEVQPMRCLRAFGGLYHSYSRMLGDLSALSPDLKAEKIRECSEISLPRMLRREPQRSLVEPALSERATMTGDETAEERRVQTWRLMTVSHDLRDRKCLDSRQRSFFEGDHSFINMQSGDSCNEFQGSTASDDSQGFTALQSLMSGFIGSQGSEINEFLSMNGNELYCERCFREKYTTARDTRDSSAPPQDNPNTPGWVRDTDTNPNFSEVRDQAKAAITNHLVENIMKQEMLKLSIVMEQFTHAKALDSAFPYGGNESELTCNDPSKLLAAIQRKCGNRRIFRSDVMGNRIKNVFKSLGVPESSLSTVTRENNWGLATGLSHILSKVNSVTPQDGSTASCGTVNRIDVATLRQRDERTNESAELFKAFFSAVLISDQGSSVLSQLTSSESDNQRSDTRVVQKALSSGLQNALQSTSEEGQMIRELLTGEYMLTQEQREGIFLETGLRLPLDSSMDPSEQANMITRASFRIFNAIAKYNPNMFMFINDPTVRRRFASSPDSLLDNLFGPNVNQDAFRDFAQRCNTSFEKIAEVACTEENNLENFSKSDIAIAAQEIASELEDEDSKRRDLAVIALGSEVCQQKISNHNVDSPQYIDLDQQLPVQFSQSDFMRANKRPHEFQDPNFQYPGVDAEQRSEAIAINRENRLLNEANLNDNFYCNAQAREFVAQENECYYHQRNCQTFRTEQVENEAAYNEAYTSIESSSPPTSSGRRAPNRRNNNNNNFSPNQLASGNQNTLVPNDVVTPDKTASGDGNSTPKSPTDHQITPDKPAAAQEESIFGAIADSFQNNSITTPTITTPTRSPASTDAASLEPASISERDQAIREVASHGNLGQRDLNSLSTDELRSMANALGNKDSMSDDNREAIENEYEDDIAELARQREELEQERERLRRSRESFESDTEGLGSQGGPIASAQSGSRTPGSSPVIAAPAIPVISGGVVAPGTGSSSAPGDSSGRLARAQVGSSGSGRSQLVLFLENPESVESLPAYLTQLERYGLVTEPDYINIRDNGRVIEVPGPDGRVVSFVVSELPREARRRIQSIIETRRQAQADLNSPSIQGRQRRPVMQVLAEQEARINNSESQVNNRFAVYQDFLSALRVSQ